MESNVWDFNLNGLNTIDAISSIDAGTSGINSDQPAFNNTMPPLASGTQGSGSSSLQGGGSSSLQGSGSSSLQGGLQNPEMQDSLGQLHAFPSMQFSSNHLLVAAKWFHQKKLQRALASSNPHILPAAHLHVDDPVCPPSHGPQEAAKNSLKRLLEGAAGANESLSAGSNGSKTSSPHQISCDSLSSSLVTSMMHPPYHREALSFTTGKEHIEHPSFFFHSRPEFHEGLRGSFHSPSAHMNPFQDTMWHSHSQGSCGVLGPPFSCHHGFNQPRDACEGVSGKAKPRVRARRGQATDPHSIAERLRRERIAERIKLLQELVPHTNKTDRAIMLDEIIEYVKFLLIQVKVLSMSRLGGAGLVLPLVASLSEVKSMPTPTEVLGECAGPTQDNMPAIEEHVARLISNNAGAALQFLQRKGLCLMPMSMAESTSKASADASLSQTCLSNQSNSTSITTLADKCRMQT